MPTVDRIQVNVTSTQLLAAVTGRSAVKRRVVVKNKHSASIWVKPDVAATQANGLEVEANASSPEFVLDPGESLNAISVAQTAAGAVHVIVTDDVRE